MSKIPFLLEQASISISHVGSMICGNVFGHTAGAAIVTATTTVCCKLCKDEYFIMNVSRPNVSIFPTANRCPFTIQFASDQWEFVGAAKQEATMPNTGFRLAYIQVERSNQLLSTIPF